MNPLFLTEDSAGRTAIGLRQPGSMDYLKLAAHTGVTITVPTNAKHVLFSGNTDFFVRYTSTVMTSAVYAASSVTASGVCGGTGCDMNPVLRSLVGVTGLSVIAPVAGDLTLCWYS